MNVLVLTSWVNAILTARQLRLAALSLLVVALV
jgi:hypothetical protein